MSEGSTGASKQRVRARVACRACNHRKVRCDVTKTGQPCSNCRHESAACEVFPRKKHRPRRDRKSLQALESTAVHDRDSNPGPLSNPSTRLGAQTVHDPQLSRDNENAQRDIRTSISQLAGLPNEYVNSPSKTLAPDVRGESNKGPGHSAEPEGVLPDDTSLSYIGDRRGPRFFVYDLCYPEAPQDAMPYLAPRKSDTSWRPHEVDYLHQQGAFTTFSDDVCDDLIRSYFYHVHWFLPVVDAASFLSEYDNNGRQNISLLLFWSMLLAAANFAEPDVLRKSGFASRKAMKTIIYQRAKALYDLDRGTDKLILIQSVLLLSFWYTDAQDHTGAWYWVGVATTLAQSLGLHRTPQIDTQSHANAQLSRIRRIWWSCLVRDRWLSLAKGRPTRIHHEDCDLPLPEIDDVLRTLPEIQPQTRDKFLPQGAESLAKMWVNLVRISDALGKTLRIHYTISGPKPGPEDIEISAHELQQCKPTELFANDRSQLLLIHAYHLELFYEATVAVLYRPYVLSSSSVSSSEVRTPWQNKALDHARTSASNTNNVLEKIIEQNMVNILKPMMITTMIPAMQIHLFDCKSPVQIRRGLGSNKLNLCLLVLSQMRDTYWSASVIYRLFERAQNMLDRTKANPPIEQGEGRSLSSQSIPISQSNEIQNQQEQPMPQHFNNTANVIPPMDSSLLINAESTPSWFNNSSDFNNVDQLLDPTFSIEGNMYQPYFMGYDNTGMAGAYDPAVASNQHMNAIYHV